MRHRQIPLIAAFIALLPLYRTVHAQDDGRQWLDRVARTYEELSSYHFEGIALSKISGFSNSSSSASFVRYAKPKENKIRYQTGIGRSRCVASSDGISTILYSGQIRQYVQKQSPDIQAVLKDILIDESNLCLGPALPASYATLGLRASSVKVLGQEKIRLKSARVDCVVVQVELKPDYAAPQTRAIRTLWIDPDSSLVLRDSTRFQAISSKGKVFFDSREEMRLSSFRINEEIEDSIFQFNPPRSARRSDSLRLDDSDFRLTVNPPISTTVLADLDGHSYTFEGLQEHIVILDFWASWCVPCHKEMKLLEKIHRRYKDKGLVVFGINRESVKIQTDFLKKKSFSYPMLLDSRGILTQRFSASNLPTFVLIDRKGRIASWEQGLLTEEEMERLLKPLGFQ